MAAKGISTVKSQKKSRGFAAALTLAFLEWMLIFMLYVDAIFSYFVTSFARCCKLQVPCLLCSRLDHVLGNEKQGYYQNLVCGAHKREISSLVLCHAHNELVDIHGLCETCLFSFATINKSNAETYRLLVAKLGEDSVIGDDDQLFEGHTHGSSSPRNCSCCKRPWVPRRAAQKLFTSKAIDCEASELDLPVLGFVEQGRSEQKKRMDRQAGSFKLVNNGDDLLSHVVYSELKITSDTESEVHISEDDEVHSLVRKSKGPQKDSILMNEVSERQSITIADAIASENLIHLTSEPEPKPSLLVSTVQSVLNTSHDGGILKESTVAIGHGLEELKWQHIESKENSLQTEFISFDDVLPSSGISENPIQASTNTFECASVTVEAGRTCTPVTEEVPREESQSTAVIARAMEENSESQLQMPVKESTDGSTQVIEEVSQEKSLPTTTIGMGLEVKCETGSQIPGNLEFGDAYKIAIGIAGRQVSGLSGEQQTLSNSTRVSDLFGELRSISNSTRVSEDLKVLLSQLSRGIEFPSFDMSPRVSRNTEELKPADAADSGMHILQKRASSLERNESGLESLDGSFVGEIEGESLVERLKRQIEHDKKLLSCLYKELEEERNASAIAANQAMAMITKLQEEKASLHMDASQYLRMMEEQAEYDMEALQRANDDLVDKEKEIQDLEAELEFYRLKYPDEGMSENVLDPITEERDIRKDHSGASCIEDKNVGANLVADTDILSHKFGKNNTLSEEKIRTPTNSFSKSEGERLSRSLSPKALAEKLHLHSGKQLDLGYANGECTKHNKEKEIHLNELNRKGDNEEINITENKLAKRDDTSQAEEGSSSRDTTYLSFESSQSNGKETRAVIMRKEMPDSEGSSKASHVNHNAIENSINFQKHENEEIPERLEAKAITE